MYVFYLILIFVQNNGTENFDILFKKIKYVVYFYLVSQL